MHGLKSLLAIHNPSEGRAALDCAVRIARSTGAALTVASTLEGFNELNRSSDPVAGGFWDKVYKAHADEMKALASMLEGEGVRTQGKVLSGIPFIEVIREVLGSAHGLVIKNSEGRGGVRGALFGSTDLHLLRKCPCPVWLVKRSHTRRFTRILAAVDPDPLDEKRDALNIRILEAAAELARMEKGRLLIVHAWGYPAELVLRARGLVPERDLETYLNEAHAARRGLLKRLLERAPLKGVEYEIHLLKGAVWELIPALQQEKKADLAVLGTVARTGLPGLLMGNTAERLLNKIDCSVLALKPEGFRTPVEA